MLYENGGALLNGDLKNKLFCIYDFVTHVLPIILFSSANDLYCLEIYQGSVW